MEAVMVRIFENGLVGLLNREDFNPLKHRLLSDEQAEAQAVAVDESAAEEPAEPAEPAQRRKPRKG